MLLYLILVLSVLSNAASINANNQSETSEDGQHAINGTDSDDDASSSTITKCELDSTEERLARGMQDFVQARRASLRTAQKNRRKGAKPVIRTYELRIIFHVITSSDGKQGYVPLDSLVANMDSANKVFAGLSSSRGRGPESNIRVTLAGVTYTNNSDWFFNCAEFVHANRMKFATALSAANTVNVWTCDSTTRLGWVNFLPYELPQHSVWNGLNLNYRGLPPSLAEAARTRNFLRDYADGDTFTHELGHYLGLLHTFGNGVTGCDVGDNVDDTPAEAIPATPKACHQAPIRDSCPGRPGVDPVWNIMDYSDDTCAEEFTKGQINVMRYSLEQYKNVLLTNEPFRCVADGTRGTSSRMTVCKSECFTDRVAPDGRTAPSQGWCRTDAVGNWGSCCCGDTCLPRKTLSRPPPLSCAAVQAREETFRSGGAQGLCLTASIFSGSRESQVYLSSCGISEFKRWAVNFDGGIASIGAGWCMAVLGVNGTDLTKLEGRRIGLEPCVAQKPNQKWVPLPVTGKSVGSLSLNRAPGFCAEAVDGVLVMRPCSDAVVEQDWSRSSRPNCGTLRTMAQCRNSAASLGCLCRWSGKRCINA